MHTDNQIWLVFMKGLSKPSADDGGVALLVIYEEKMSINTLAKFDLDAQTQKTAYREKRFVQYFWL